MITFQSIQRLFRKSHQAAPPSKRIRTHNSLNLEVLEARWVPAISVTSVVNSLYEGNTAGVAGHLAGPPFSTLPRDPVPVGQYPRIHPRPVKLHHTASARLKQLRMKRPGEQMKLQRTQRRPCRNHGLLLSPIILPPAPAKALHQIPSGYYFTLVYNLTLIFVKLMKKTPKTP